MLCFNMSMHIVVDFRLLVNMELVVFSLSIFLFIDLFDFVFVILERQFC